jgi:hypothetical protein
VATRALHQTLLAIRGDGTAKADVQNWLQGGAAQDARAARDWTNVALSIFGGGTPTYQVDTEAGTVQFGDGERGEVPPAGTHPAPESGAGQVGATPIHLPKPPLDPRGGGRVEQQALDPGGGGRDAQAALRSVIQDLQAGDLIGAKAAWQSLGTEAMGPDVNALIQFVLRESYMESDSDLRSFVGRAMEGASVDVEELFTKYGDTLSLMANMSRTFSDARAG